MPSTPSAQLIVEPRNPARVLEELESRRGRVELPVERQRECRRRECEGQRPPAQRAFAPQQRRDHCRAERAEDQHAQERNRFSVGGKIHRSALEEKEEGEHQDHAHREDQRQALLHRTALNHPQAVAQATNAGGESVHDVVNDIVVKQPHDQGGQLQRDQPAQAIDLAHAVVHELDPFPGKPAGTPVRPSDRTSRCRG